MGTKAASRPYVSNRPAPTSSPLVSSKSKLICNIKIQISWFDPTLSYLGARDGHLMLWDTRRTLTGRAIKPVHQYRNIHCVNTVIKGRKSKTSDSHQSVTCVLFSTDSNYLFTAGAVDGCVKLWDLRKMRERKPVPLHTLNQHTGSPRRYGVSSLVSVFSCCFFFRRISHFPLSMSQSSPPSAFCSCHVSLLGTRFYRLPSACQLHQQQDKCL